LSKIEGNRRRDIRIRRDLRRRGIAVMRIWEHELITHADECGKRIGRKLATLARTAVGTSTQAGKRALRCPSRRTRVQAGTPHSN
jgi:G:T-mismatch repair DNA endonuclease (very short patch repair protein)